MLELNSSFLWIFFLVWVLYFALNRIFFKPVGRIISEREAKIAADAGRQESMVAEIETRTRAVETELGQARKEAQRIKEGWLKNGEEIRNRTVNEARERAARMLAERIAQLDVEIAASERALESQVSLFSDMIKQAYL
jgi:F-type H+-transporting ATPase subunit b